MEFEARAAEDKLRYEFELRYTSDETDETDETDESDETDEIDQIHKLVKWSQNASFMSEAELPLTMFEDHLLGTAKMPTHQQLMAAFKCAQVGSEKLSKKRSSDGEGSYFDAWSQMTSHDRHVASVARTTLSYDGMLSILNREIDNANTDLSRGDSTEEERAKFTRRLVGCSSTSKPRAK